MTSSRKEDLMKNEILIVFENEKVFAGALVYAREYALRTDAKVTFLMLAAVSFTTQDPIGAKRNDLHKIEASTGRLLAELTESFIQKGLETSSALKIGDPSHELLKFLADRPSFQAIVWGSEQDFITRPKSRGKHWLQALASSLECPLLTVSHRSNKREGSK